MDVLSALISQKRTASPDQPFQYPLLIVECRSSSEQPSNVQSVRFCPVERRFVDFALPPSPEELQNYRGRAETTAIQRPWIRSLSRKIGNPVDARLYLDRCFDARVSEKPRLHAIAAVGPRCLLGLFSVVGEAGLSVGAAGASACGLPAWAEPGSACPASNPADLAGVSTAFP